MPIGDLQLSCFWQISDFWPFFFRIFLEDFLWYWL